MAEFSQAEQGTICLITETIDGRIAQIGLTQEQSELLNIFLATLSKDNPLVIMGDEYDLILKTTEK